MAENSGGVPQQRSDFSLPTSFDGIEFRSRIEARWYVFFKAMGIEAHYEYQGYRLPDGRGYLPDFYIPPTIEDHEFGCHVEIKGKYPSLDEQKKLVYVSRTTREHSFLFYGTMKLMMRPLQVSRSAMRKTTHLGGVCNNYFLPIQGKTFNQQRLEHSVRLALRERFGT